MEPKMEIADILNELNRVFNKTFENDSILLKEETTAKDIKGWDSLSHVQMITEVENHFKITFTTPEIMRFRNVGMMCQTLQKKLRNK